jgi:hypothetical protein
LIASTVFCEEYKLKFLIMQFSPVLFYFLSRRDPVLQPFHCLWCTESEFMFNDRLEWLKCLESILCFCFIEFFNVKFHPNPSPRLLLRLCRQTRWYPFPYKTYRMFTYYHKTPYDNINLVCMVVNIHWVSPVFIFYYCFVNIEWVYEVWSVGYFSSFSQVFSDPTIATYCSSAHDIISDQWKTPLSICIAHDYLNGGSRVLFRFPLS